MEYRVVIYGKSIILAFKNGTYLDTVMKRINGARNDWCP
jgi:hypothetical protein